MISEDMKKRIFDLRTAEFGNFGSFEEFEPVLQNNLSIEVFEGDTLVGYAIYSIDEKHMVVHLEEILISSDRRREGLATYLISELQKSYLRIQCFVDEEDYPYQELLKDNNFVPIGNEIHTVNNRNNLVYLFKQDARENIKQIVKNRIKIGKL